MNKTIYITALLLFGIFNINAQSKRDYNWVIGYERFFSNPGLEGMIINFDNQVRIIDTVDIGCQMEQVNAVISSEEGELLFYTNGCVIIDSTHNIMENGENINPGYVHDEQCANGGYVGIADSAILPDPGNPSGYFLFHKPIEIIVKPENTYVVVPSLQYSYINMNGNNGLGTVIEKNIPYYESDYSINIGYFEAIKHSNKKDWWFIQTEELTNLYLKFLLTEEGVELVDTQSLGPQFSIHTSASGDAVFTPDGTKYLMYNNEEDLLVYDFNRTTGHLSNLQRVLVDDDGKFCGVAVSPNGRFAYLSSSLDLWQVDLEAQDLQTSLTHIAQYDGFGEPFPTNFFLAQLAPDCKIYITSTNGTRFLHVINSPNEQGIACDFRQHYVELPWDNASGSIPNVPYFRIDEEEICDPTITNVFDFPVIIDNEINIFPNPTSDRVTMDNVSDYESVTLINVSGNPIFTYDLDGRTQHSIDLPNDIQPGIYFLRFLAENGRNVMKKLVVSR